MEARAPRLRIHYGSVRILRHHNNTLLLFAPFPLCTTHLSAICDISAPSMPSPDSTCHNVLRHNFSWPYNAAAQGPDLDSYHGLPLMVLCEQVRALRRLPRASQQTASRPQVRNLPLGLRSRQRPRRHQAGQQISARPGVYQIDWSPTLVFRCRRLHQERISRRIHYSQQEVAAVFSGTWCPRRHR